MHDVAVAATRSARPTSEIARWSAGSVAALLAGAAFFLAWRRLAGALTTPLSSLPLPLVAASVAAAAAGARIAWRIAEQELPSYSAAGLPSTANAERRRGLPPLSPARSLLLSAAVLVLGASLSLPGTNVAALTAFWSLLIAEECWAWRPMLWQRLRGTVRTPSATRPERADLAEVPWPPAASSSAVAEPPAAEVVQQLTRSRAANGSDELAGWLRMEFSPGQRSGSIHVAFCPPFARTPELAVEQVEGREMRIKTAQLLPYGARLDLKLAIAADQPATVLLRFSARSQAAE